MCGLSSRTEYVDCAHGKTCQIFPATAKHLILLLTLVWSCLLDWMIEVCRNKTIQELIHLTNRRFNSIWKNHIKPQQLDTSFSCQSPAWFHTAVGWLLVLQLEFVTSQPIVSVCHSGTNSTASHKCSMGLRSGRQAGYSILSTLNSGGSL